MIFIQGNPTTTRSRELSGTCVRWTSGIDNPSESEMLFCMETLN